MLPLRMRENLKNGEEMAAVTQEAFQRETKYENCYDNWDLGFSTFEVLICYIEKEW